jgi:hypothetical protein
MGQDDKNKQAVDKGTHRQRVKQELNKVSEQQRTTQQRRRHDRTDDSGSEEER